MIPRVIPCLLLRNGGLVKTTRFADQRYLGDPLNTVKLFNDKEVDELILLDIDASAQGREPSLEFVAEISSQCFMPLCIGGGIHRLETAERILGAGVEKVAVNSEAIDDPSFVSALAARVGSSSVVVSIDVRKAERNGYEVVTENGRRRTGMDPVRFAAEMEQRGAGEILLTAVDRDGTMTGYDLDLVTAVSQAVRIPVVACGGAGTIHDLVRVVEAGASAAAAGSLFVFHGKRRAVLVNVPTRRALERAFADGSGMMSDGPRTVGASYRMCSRCVMDTSDPDIHFDSAGVCSHCRAFERARRSLPDPDERRARLDRLVAEVQRAGKGTDYDCIIGVSGGVDSSYVAYLVRQFGLRPLAVHMDNGWNSELAVANVENTLRRLGIDLQTYVVDWEEFRDLHRAFLRASVINAELPTDHAIMATLYRTAAELGVRFIIGGSNTATEGVMPYAWVHDYKDLVNIRRIHARYGAVPLRTYPQLGIARYLRYRYGRRIQLIRILEFVEYDKKKAMETLQQELGWRPYGGKHYESVFTRFFQGYILPRKFGVDKRRAHLSTLICSGQMDRDSALAELESSPYGDADPDEERRYVERKLGFPTEEFDEILATPPRPHESYGSSVWVLHLLRRLARGLGAGRSER